MADEPTWSIDEHDRIIAFDGEPVAPDEPNPTGRSMFESISSTTVAEIYRLVIQRTRLIGEVSFVYRCDSPEMLRLERMQVHRNDDGSVTFRSLTLAEQARAPQVERPASLARKEHGLAIACSWCARVRTLDGWAEPERCFMPSPQRGASQMQFTHTVCEDCFELLTEHLEGRTDAADDPERVMWGDQAAARVTG